MFWPVLWLGPLVWFSDLELWPGMAFYLDFLAWTYFVAWPAFFPGLLDVHLLWHTLDWPSSLVYPDLMVCPVLDLGPGLLAWPHLDYGLDF